MSAYKRLATSSMIRNYVQRLPIKNLQLTDRPTVSATFTTPGLGMDAFDRYGHPAATQLILFPTISRMWLLHHPLNKEGKTFLDWAQVTSDRLTFLSSTIYHMHRGMYDPEVTKWPLKVKVTLGYVGTASYALQTKIFSADLPDQPIMTQVSQTVSVSKETRKPMPFPDWFLDKYRGKGIFKKGLVLKPFPRPENTFVFPTKVLYLDTNNYGHTNYGSYIRFAVNALHAALKTNENSSTVESVGETSNLESTASPLHRDTKGFVANGLKSIAISYQNESLEGQDLHAHIWQEKEEGNLVMCSIERGESKLCQLKLEYYDSS